MFTIRRHLFVAAAAICSMHGAFAQQLDTHFSCSTEGTEYNERVIYADTGTFKLDGAKIVEFNWESSKFRTTHGFDCSIDLDDQLQAEVRSDDNEHATWRVSPVDGAQARKARGFDFGSHTNCSVRVIRNGDQLEIKPTCPALCGSRENFSAVTVDLKNGSCRYDQ